MIAQLKYRASAVLMAASMAFVGCDNTETTTTSSTDTAVLAPTADAGTTTTTTTTTTTLNTNDTYTDLRTGKKMHVKQMAMNSGTGGTSSGDASMGSSSWVWENDQPLDYFYVNDATHDTFQGATGQLVSGYLLYDAASKKYSLDEMRYEKNGDGYKAKSMDGDVKVKENENELKVKDDNNNTKLKANDNEVKYKDKDNDIKYKSNGDETKIKTKDQKIKIDEDGNTTVKPR